MQNFISSSDLLCWNIVLNGNSAKSMTTDKDGNLKIRPPVTAEEHQHVQREEKARTILLSTLPDEHMGDFYHMIDARDIWNAIKARFEEGFDKGYDKMQKILSQMNTLKIKPEPEDVNIKFLRGLPPSWSSIALILKTKGGLEYISFDDLYNKLKFLEIDTKGYSSSFSTLSNAAFVSTAGSSKGKLSYQESGNDGYGGYTTTLSASPGSSSSNGSIKYKCSVVDDVIYSFFANHKIDQQLVYEDLDQMNKEEFEKECRAQGGQNSNNYQKYKKAGKDGTDSKAMVVVDRNADSEGEVVSADDVIPAAAAVSVSAGPVAAAAVSVSTGPVAATAIISPHSETEFAFMGLSTEISIPVTCLQHHLPMTFKHECSRPNQCDHDSNDSIYSVSAPTSESSDTIVIDCARQEDFPSVCTSSIESDVKSSNTLCNKFGSFNKESYFRKHKSVASKSCYVCGSYLHLIKDCDFHEQRFAKRNAKGKGILKSRPTGKPVNPNRPKLVSAGRPNPVSASRPNPISADQPNLVSAGQPNTVFAGDGILGSGPLNIQSKSTYFHSFTHNNQQIFFPITHNSLYSLYLIGGLNGKTAVKPSAGWPWIKYVSQTCDQSHRVLFTENECLVLYKDFPLPDPSMVILFIPRKQNLYTFSLNELAPKGPLTCLISKASQNESTLWHRRLGHVNFRNMNKLVKGNLVRGLPSKVFQNNHTCVACNKGKQHKASYKAIPSISLITKPIHLLYMDLFGPTSVWSINNKYYCLVIIDEYTGFSWVYFLEHKSETFFILKFFITLVENQFNHKVKAIRCDNGTEFKNANLIEFCGSKGIRRDHSNARTPQ
nr:putative ribonuclease H-like domain-containing protein [Tanacetum cinerariifolium]